MRLREETVPPNLLACELRADRAVADDKDTIASRGNFLEVARSHHDRRALPGRAAQHVVKVAAGADIDAGSRIDQDQRFWLLRQCAGEQHFLLIAAGEALH